MEILFHCIILLERKFMNGEEEYFGEIAEQYEKERKSETIWPKEQAFIAKFVSTIPSWSSILDIPTGTGRFLGIYANKHLIVTAADISKDMLNIAQLSVDWGDYYLPAFSSSADQHPFL
jgi:ubiquinone/menaquinone biosynthesis C-methylase UbiE